MHEDVYKAKYSWIKLFKHHSLKRIPANQPATRTNLVFPFPTKASHGKPDEGKSAWHVEDRALRELQNKFITSCVKTGESGGEECSFTHDCT